MFKQEILEGFFAHEEMTKIPIGAQAEIIEAFEEVLETVSEENGYKAIAQLFQK